MCTFRICALVVLLCCVMLVSCSWVKDAGVAVFGDGFFEDDEDVRIQALTEFKPRLKTSEVWSAGAGAGARDSHAKLLPLSSGGAIFTVDPEGEVRAFSVRRGELKWRRSFDVPVSFGVAGGRRTLMIGTASGEVVAFAADNGRPLWRKRLSGDRITAISRGHHGLVLVRDSAGRVIAATIADGGKRWEIETELPILTLRGMSVPHLHGDFGFVGLDDGRLLIIVLDSGRVHRELRIGLVAKGSDLERVVDIDGQFEIYDDILYVAAYRGRLLAFDTRTQAVLWLAEVGTYAGLDVDSERVYVVGTGGQVRALDRFSGTEIWNNPAFAVRTLAAPLVSGRTVVVGDNFGYLYWLSRDDGSILVRRRIARSPVVSAPVAWRNQVIALTRGGDLVSTKIVARLVARSR